MIDNQLALQARANILWLADHWTHLTARLTPGSSASTSEVRAPSPERQLPIDTYVSDLMAEIDWVIARHYCHVLIDETDDVTHVPSTPEGRLRLVAERYGHFLGDDMVALTFCDDAEDYRGRVERTLERPPAAEYLGPCPIADCAGELYVRGSASTVRCPACLTETTRDEQRGWVGAVAAKRRYTYSEIPRALKVLGIPVSERTWERWTSAGTDEEPKEPKIAKDSDGLYGLTDVVELALQSSKNAPRRPLFEEMLATSQRLALLEGVG